ncbi:MAG: glycosyltransferase family 39 protein [Isosphaeraceae bacterium]|nr:glycosyltransferase family 39 protein [Isosphaeraceae bacterium]
MARRRLLGIALLAAVLHLIGLWRASLPAQDGLKFIRVARQFQARPWIDVVRDSDQHPLYPALIALAQPAAAAILGDGPEAWRIAAGGISTIASIALLFPLYGLAESLFDRRVAALTALLYVLLPLPGELAYDTLSDSLALLFTVMALRLGAMTLRSRRFGPALGCGVLAGLGYWTRPEVLVVPLAVLVTAAARWVAARGRSWPRDATDLEDEARSGRAPVCWAGLAVAFLAMVGSYAFVKGELSEKLALRRVAVLPSQHDVPRRVGHPLPEGLDDPRWDFSPKEEAPGADRLGFATACGRVFEAWGDGIGWYLFPLPLLAIRRTRPGAACWLIVVYMILFSLILVRHTMTLGYLSGRHALAIVLATLPWAAEGAMAFARIFGARLDSENIWARRWGLTFMVVLIGVCVSILLKPDHPTRWGHLAAGRWLARNARPGDAVLDTRGWAAFVSGRPNYDYWHVRQALTDARLAYVVVGADELSACSRRAETLRAVLAYAAEPVADFPERQGGSKVGVRVFRFRRPESWEGLRP